MYTAGGAREIVAVAVHMGTNHLVYRPFVNYVRDYGERFPLGNIVECDLNRDLV